MTAWRSAPAVVALAVVLGPAATAASAQEPLGARSLCRFSGPTVREASGLVDAGDRLYTANDSGDAAAVYTIDPRTCRVAATTTYAPGATDVEALAPGPRGSVWVGDIGDNRERRDTVTVVRVRPTARGELSRAGVGYRLRYPDGPHDAETLLSDPVDGRLYVVSKSPLGGTVYAAPQPLRAGADNRLRRFATVAGLVTDGAFTPDGRHVLIRRYASATLYTFPAFDEVRTVALPRQKQGEAVSVAADGRVLVTSEGVGARVLEVTLPRELKGLLQPVASPAPSAAPRADRSDPGPEATSGTSVRTGALVALGALLVGVAAYGLAAVRGARRRAPRRR